MILFEASSFVAAKLHQIAYLLPLPALGLFGRFIAQILR